MPIDDNTSSMIGIEHKHTDTFKVLEKLKQGAFSDSSLFDNVLKAYDILLLQKEQDLIVEKSLRSRVILFPHQYLAALRVKNDFSGSALLADEVGLGKTIEAGILIKEYLARGLARKILVLTPATLVTQWKQELLDKFDEEFVAALENDGNFIGWDKHDKMICSINKAKEPKNAPLLTSTKWDIVVVDEAHRLKNHLSMNFKFVNSLQRKYLFLLTATPVQNNLQELYNLVSLLRPGILGTWNSFKRLYIQDSKFRVLNRTRVNELQDLLANVIIRTRREEVRAYITLPARIPQMHRILPSDQEGELYQRVTSFIRKKAAAGAKGTDKFELIRLQKQLVSSTAAIVKALEKKRVRDFSHSATYEELMNIAAKVTEDSKLQRLKEVVNSLNDGKLLIFTEFLTTQDYISEWLNENGFKTVIYNGELSVFEKDLVISKFKNDAQIMVCTDAGSEGKNFQFCHTLVNYDLPWNPMKVEQRVGRLHRIGQNHDVTIHSFSLSDTIEDYVLHLLYKKISLFQMTIGDLDVLFEDEDRFSEDSIFDTYMAASDERDAHNRFTVLGDGLLEDKRRLEQGLKEFDATVFQNFDFSAMRKLGKNNEQPR